MLVICGLVARYPYGLEPVISFSLCSQRLPRKPCRFVSSRHDLLRYSERWRLYPSRAETGMNLWRSMSLAPRDMARRRRRALRKRQDDQIQNEDESSSSTPPEATGTATGNDDQPEDNKKEGEQTSEGEPSPTGMPLFIPRQLLLTL